MKTKHITSLFAAALSLVLATSVSAAPASKRIGPRQESPSTSTSAPAEHKVMKRIGPIGKGYSCNR